MINFLMTTALKHILQNINLYDDYGAQYIIFSWSTLVKYMYVLYQNKSLCSKHKLSWCFG